jgi:hypothetical protein
MAYVDVAQRSVATGNRVKAPAGGVTTTYIIVAFVRPSRPSC